MSKIWDVIKKVQKNDLTNVLLQQLNTGQAMNTLQKVVFKHVCNWSLEKGNFTIIYHMFVMLTLQKVVINQSANTAHHWTWMRHKVCFFLIESRMLCHTNLSLQQHTHKQSMVYYLWQNKQWTDHVAKIKKHTNIWSNPSLGIHKQSWNQA